MATSAPRSPPVAGSDQPSAGSDRPLHRADDFAGDGCWGTGPGSTAVDGVVVEWQLAVFAGASR
jgi:hypothetical protein